MRQRQKSCRSRAGVGGGGGRRGASGEEKPRLRHAVVQEQLKDEDVYLVVDDVGVFEGGAASGLAEWKLYCVADGHGGRRCAKFVRKHIGPTLSQLLPRGRPPPVDTPEGAAFCENVRRAVVDSFISLNEAFEMEGCRISGTTVSVALVCGWLLTVANVGDSEVFLDTTRGTIEMSCCHKIDDNVSEQKRLQLAGVRVDTLGRRKCGPPAPGEKGVGPKRVWPGGVAMSRSLGDLDCGQHVLPVPHIRQLIIPSSGARLVMASDGLWDHLSGSQACKGIRTVRLGQAPWWLLDTARRTAGRLSDDTTILIVDILPRGTSDYADISDNLRKKAAAPFRALARSIKINQSFACFGGALAGELKLYSDVDGNLEYPGALHSRKASAPFKDTTAQSFMHSCWPKCSSESWDMCSCAWDCSNIEDDFWINFRENNVERSSEEIDDHPGIMDSAQNYSEHVRNPPQHKQDVNQVSLPYKIRVSQWRVGTNKTINGTPPKDVVSPLHVEF